MTVHLFKFFSLFERKAIQTDSIGTGQALPHLFEINNLFPLSVLLGVYYSMKIGLAACECRVSWVSHMKCSDVLLL